MPPYSNYSKGLKRKTGAVKTTHAMSLQVFTSNICTQSEIEKQACILQTKKYSKQLKTVEPPRLVTLSTTRYILLEILKKLIISTKAGIDIANINPLDY